MVADFNPIEPEKYAREHRQGREGALTCGKEEPLADNLTHSDGD